MACFEVTRWDGEIDRVRAERAFVDDVLEFRDKSDVVAAFAPGTWKRFRKVVDGPTLSGLPERAVENDPMWEPGSGDGK